MGLIARLQERLLGVAPWDAGQITDEWFRAHFEYAADVVNHWVGGVLDIPKSRFLNCGCGDCITDLSLALRYGATSIHGVDVRREYQKLPRIAREQLGMQRVPVALAPQEAAAGLLSGWTPAGLLDRFEGSGLRLRVDAVSEEPLPRGLLAAVEARRAAGLPTDEAALRASSWSVRVDAPASGAFSGPGPGPANRP